MSRNTLARQSALVFVVWTSLALLETSQDLRDVAVEDWGAIVLSHVLNWYEVGIFLPLILVLAHKAPLEGQHLVGRSLLHLSTWIVGAVARGYVFPLLRQPFEEVARRGSADTVSMSNVVSDLLVFATMDALAHGVVYYRRYHQEALDKLRLRAELSSLRLQALRAQLDPHFLLNTLNAAVVLVHRNPLAADRMLTGLGELLSVILDQRAEQIPLAEELRLLDQYLEIMEIRFPTTTVVHRDIDVRAEHAMIPPLLLQPIVENALVHGIGRMSRPGTLSIAMALRDTHLEIIVEDDGPGLGESAPVPGLGTTLTANRLHAMYGDDATFDLLSRPEGGTRAIVRIPQPHLEEAGNE